MNYCMLLFIIPPEKYGILCSYSDSDDSLYSFWHCIAYSYAAIALNCSCTKVRMKFDVLLHFRFALSMLWKPNKTRSCRKEAKQRIHLNYSCTKLRMKSDVLLCFRFELWKPNKTRNCSKEAAQNQETYKNKQNPYKNQEL